MGRRSLLTDEFRARAQGELDTGAALEVVAQRIGVARRTVARWIDEGKLIRPESPPPAVAVGMLEEPELVGEMVAAARRGQWQAAAWLLERAFPEKWGKDARPVTRSADAFSDLDELAAKRRRTQ
jgi:transposase